MTTLLTLLVVFGLALTLSLVLTPQVIRYAKACGWVSTPREDRYSDTATPLMGGIAIVAAAGLATLIGFRHLSTLHLHILAAGLLMFAVGVYDDRRTLTAKTKLLWQAGAALWLVAAGVRFGIGGDAWLWVDRLITFCWLIGITNAVNLLDNMDGLAAGVSAITATSLAIIHAIDGNLGTAVMAVALVGAALGFLRYNFQPAQLFMGDCGSLFLGLTLASLALLDGGENPARGLLPVLALPILVLVLPLTDTLLVSIMRPRHGKKITEGGCDHTSHRLTKLGASTRDAVLMLYALAGLSAVLALVVRWLDWYWGHLLLPLFALGVLLFAAYLAQVYPYDDRSAQAPQLGQTARRPTKPLLSRSTMTLILDILCVIVGLYAAALLKFDDQLRSPILQERVLLILPLVVLAHVGSYALLGVYKGIWRRTSVRDLPRYLGATGLAFVLTIVLLWVFGLLVGTAKTMLAINFLVQFALLTGTRIGVRALDELLPRHHECPRKRALMVGAIDRIDHLVRHLELNPAWQVQPAAVMCEDPEAVGRVLRGLPVVGTSEHIATVLLDHHLDEVILLDPAYPAECWERIRRLCRERGVRTLSLNIGLSVVDAGAGDQHHAAA